MKPWRWLILLLVLVIAALIFVSRKKNDSGSVVPPVASTDTSTSERADAAGRTSTAEGGATRSAPPPESSVQAAFDELESANHLQIIVQDEGGRPLQSASIRTSFRAEQRRPAFTNLSRTFTTSSQGIADVRWPTQKIEQFEIAVSKDDYSPRKMIWDFGAGDQVPAHYTVKLTASVHIGGYVVDPEGNPIAEATVSLNRFWRGNDEMKNQGEESNFPTQKHTTSSDGHWTARNLPPDLLERIGISGSHTNFRDAYVSMDGKPEIEKELRAGTYKLQLTRGLIVQGRVINEQQQPIAKQRFGPGAGSRAIARPQRATNLANSLSRM